MYVLIGDGHGHASKLKALLAKMGYPEVDGVWRHSERRLIFLGGFVDRGPEQVETITIARNMARAGSALAVIGNHEFNAVCWATLDPPHTAKMQGEHHEFLDQAGEGSEQYKSVSKWSKTLSMYLGLPSLRLIQTCWNPKYLKTIGQYTDDKNRLLPEACGASSRQGSLAYDTIKTLLKGPNISLPGGH